MNALQTFEFNTHQLNVIVDDAGEPWFIAKQVAEILEYSDAHKMASKLDEDEKSNRQIGGFGPDTGGRGIICINESGLYSAILTSQKPAAKSFKRWVTHEVLPSIRKTGGYAVNANDFLKLQSEHIELLRQHINVVNEKTDLHAKMIDMLRKTPGIKRLWAPDEDEALKQFLADGFGPTGIGMQLGRTRDSVRHRIGLLREKGLLA